MSGLEKTFTYLEATYEELIPGQKREMKSKMDQCRKDYQEIRQTFMKQDQATETQKNKEELVYYTTEKVRESYIV